MFELIIIIWLFSFSGNGEPQANAPVTQPVVRENFAQCDSDDKICAARQRCERLNDENVKNLCLVEAEKADVLAAQQAQIQERAAAEKYGDKSKCQGYDRDACMRYAEQTDNSSERSDAYVRACVAKSFEGCKMAGELLASTDPKASCANFLRAKELDSSFDLPEQCGNGGVRDGVGKSQASCFNYSKLTTEQAFANGFAAAACIGYYASTVEKSDRQAYYKLKSIYAEAADVFDVEFCAPRTISVGLFGGAADKFEAGRDLAYVDAQSVEYDDMSMGELRSRISTCAEITLHYIKVTDGFAD